MRDSNPRAAENRTYAISTWPISERPRERLLEKGPDALSDAELVAILIGHGCRGRSALDLARDLLSLIGEGGLRQLPLFLGQRRGLGPAKSARILAALELGRRAWLTSARESRRITCSKDAVEFVRPKLSGLAKERFLVISLDVKNRPLEVTEVARGGVEGVTISPREVFSAAIRWNASAVLCVHNHPSGDPTPSSEDRELTYRLMEAARILGLRFLDHLILGNDQHFSFQDHGLP